MVQLYLQICDSFQRTLVIEEPSGKKIFEQKFDHPTAADQFIVDNCHPKHNWGICKAALIPVRTGLKDFYKDLFLPTVVNRAFKVSNFAYRALAVIGALALDLLTFPVRPFTFAVRLYQTRNEKPHPLHTYLLQQNVAKESLEGGRLILKFTEQSTLEYIEDRSFPNPSIGESYLKQNVQSKGSTDLFLLKYNCFPGYVERDLWNVHLIHPVKGATHRIVRVEAFERDIKINDIPHSGYFLKGGVNIKLFKNEKGTWTETDRSSNTAENYRFTEV